MKIDSMTEYSKRFITGTLLLAGLLCTFFYAPPFVLSIILFIIATYIIIGEVPHLVRSPLQMILLIAYINVAFCSLIYLNQISQYRLLFFTGILLVIGHDTGSYIIGTLLGKHKICPSISPGKTWEGFWGGYAVSCIQYIYILWWYHLSFTWYTPLFIGLICTLAFAGDLFESWLKRHAGIKDSGAILPGHGGLFDRFDSLMPVAIFLYICKDYVLFN